MDIRSKMTDAFRTAQGGLFSAVEKADVGSAYQELERRGVALMGWADPFYPDRVIPQKVLDRSVEACGTPEEVFASEAFHQAFPGA